MSDFTTGALEAANIGLPAFPLRPSEKLPAIKGWQGRATTDPDQILAWGHQFPAANVGALLRRGVFALDEDGPEAQSALRGITLPPTLRVETRRGSHSYFKGALPPGSPKYIGPQLELRGQRKTGPVLMVFPRSQVKGHQYGFLDTAPIAQAPEGLMGLIKSLVPHKAKRERGGAEVKGTPVYEGARNNTLARIAGSFVHHQITGEGLRTALHVLNRERCKPPLPEKEVEKILATANKWDVPPLWSMDPVGFAEDQRLDAKARHVLTCLAARAREDGTVRGGRWLEDVTGLHRASIYRAITDLERFGRVHVSRAHRKANSYRLILPQQPYSSKSVAESDTRGSAL